MSSYIDSDIDSLNIFANYYAWSNGSQVSDFIRFDDSELGGKRKFYVDANYNLWTIGTLGAGATTVTSLNATTLPTGTLISPPAGLNIGDVWMDTTTSAQYPILRIRKT